MKKLRYKRKCGTCRYEKRSEDIDPCLSCIEAGEIKMYKPKWWLWLFGKGFVMLIIATALLFGNVAMAAPPEVTASDNLPINDDEIDMLARLIYAEARGVDSTMEQAAVVWCVLNRVDSGHRGDTIAEVVTAHGQFAYSRKTPVKDELRELAMDVVVRWMREKQGLEDVGRVLPSEYVYFAGHGGHNWFRDAYCGGEYWDWSLPDPYAEE